MQNFRRAIGALVALVVLVMLASACGSSSEAPDVAAGSASSEATTSATSTSDAAGTSGEGASSGADEGGGEQPTSIDDYLGTAAFALRGFGGGGPGGGFGGFDSEQIEAEQQLIEIETQRCMQEQGFEYTPEADDGPRIFAALDNAALSPEDYAATQGFGISTRFDEIFAGEVDLSDDEPSANDTLLASMTEGEQEAWQFALRGAPPVRNEQGQIVDPDTGEVIPGGRGRATGGCALDAQTVVRGDLDQLGDLSDAWDELQLRIDADPEIAEIEREWAACMLDKGFDYQSVDEAREDFEQQFRPLMRSFAEASLGGAAGGDGEDGEGQGAGRRGPGGFLEAIAAAGLTDEQDAELRAVQDLEIAAAVASLECSGDGDARIAEIEAAYEAEFVTENRDLLEAFNS